MYSLPSPLRWGRAAGGGSALSSWMGREERYTWERRTPVGRQQRAFTWKCIHVFTWTGDKQDFKYEFLLRAHGDNLYLFQDRPRSWPGGSQYLSQCRQRFIDGSCLHQPLAFSFGFGNSFGASKVTQSEGTSWSQSWNLVWTHHLQRHHQVWPRTENKIGYNITSKCSC